MAKFFCRRLNCGESRKRANVKVRVVLIVLIVFGEYIRHEQQCIPVFGPPFLSPLLSCQPQYWRRVYLMPPPPSPPFFEEGQNTCLCIDIGKARSTGRHAHNTKYQQSGQGDC